MQVVFEVKNSSGIVEYIKSLFSIFQKDIVCVKRNKTYKRLSLDPTGNKIEDNFVHLKCSKSKIFFVFIIMRLAFDFRVEIKRRYKK